jgi:uncharacterized protein with FMN-binding domain
MRRLTLWLLSTVAVVVLLFSYRTSSGGSAQATTAAATPAPAASTQSGSTPSSSAASGTSGPSGTFVGSTASTRWGDVRVSITVTNGKITAVAVPVYPSGNPRDEEINAFAVPQLKQETLAAQSANIDTVSGATVTSDGYLQSLQSALDAAHLS